MRRQVVGLAVSVLLALGALAAAPVAGQESPANAAEVDGAVQVTADPNPVRGHVMPAVAVNPKDERVLAIAEGDAYGGGCSLHVSTDRGLSWSRASTPDIPERWSKCVFQSVGVVADAAFGPDGTLYYGFNGFDPVSSEGQVFLARSKDLGKTWVTTGLPRIERDRDKGEFGLDAMPSIAIDPKNPQHVYVAWVSNYGTWRLRGEVLQGKEFFYDIVMRPYIASSTDGGESFSAPVNLAENLESKGDVEQLKTPPRALVGNDGEVYVVFGEQTRSGTREAPDGGVPPPPSVYFAVSRDEGRTYQGRSIYTEPSPVDRKGALAFLWLPRSAIDRNNGNIYVVWEQDSNAGQPVSIMMVRSTDGGRQWSEPAIINDAPSPRKFTYMELFPQVSVAPNGRIDIAWYDARNDPTFQDDEGEEESKINNFHDVYYTYSMDEGKNWVPNIRLTDRLIDRRIGPSETGNVQGTLGVASTDQGAYVAWEDTRSGSEITQNQDIYFSRARLVQPESFFSTGAARPRDRLLGAVMGASLTLFVGGLALFAVLRIVSRNRALAKKEEPT